jgi:chromosome segregation ATPase
MTKPLQGDDLIEALGQKITNRKNLMNQVAANNNQIAQRQQQIANFQQQIDAINTQKQQIETDLPAMRAAIIQGIAWPPVAAATSLESSAAPAVSQ